MPIHLNRPGHIIRLTNYREGLATNSSSSHAMIRQGFSIFAYEQHDLNADDFSSTYRCVTPQAKRRYLAATITSNLRDLTDAEVQGITQILGVEVDTNDYIDNYLELPDLRENGQIRYDVIRNMAQQLDNPDIIIFGGYDETEPYSEFAETHFSELTNPVRPSL